MLLPLEIGDDDLGHPLEPLLHLGRLGRCGRRAFKNEVEVLVQSIEEVSEHLLGVTLAAVVKVGLERAERVLLRVAKASQRFLGGRRERGRVFRPTRNV